MASRHDTGTLIGRADQLDQLVALLNRADGEVALLAGEPGIGKTRLLNEGLARSRSTSLIGASSPSSLGRPFDLLLSAVEPIVRWWSAPPAALSAVSGALTNLLRSVAPTLDVEHARDDLAPGELIGAGIALLRHLSPDLLVLEDLHWADIESLQVVERLLSSPDQPTLVVTYRSQELDAQHPAAELLRLIERRHAPLHLHLEPFTVTEIDEYIRAALGYAVDERALERIRARTGGNPFFLEQLVARADLEHSDLTTASLPRTLTETIHLQLDTLTTEQRELLAAAAVVGSPFQFDLVAEMIDVNEADLITRLRAVIEEGILIEEELDSFRFRHELVRESILGSLLGRERRRRHDQAFAALQVLRPDDYTELARHARGAGRLTELVALAPKGVQHYLAAGSSFQALTLAEAALAELPDHPQLCELAARAAWLMGRLDTARHHAERWHAIAERDRSDREPEALQLLARIAYEAGETDTQHRIIDDIECRVTSEDTNRTRAVMLAFLAQHRMLTGEPQAAIERADEAIALAEILGLDDVRRRAIVERGSAMLCGADNRDAGRVVLESVAKESEAAGDDVSAARAWHNLMSAQDPNEAEQSLERMRDAAVRCGFDSMAVQYYPVIKVELALMQGQLAEARAWAARSSLFGRGSRTGRKLAVTEAILALETGDDTSATQILVELNEVADDVVTGPGAEEWIVALNMVVSARAGDRVAAESGLAGLPDTKALPAIISWASRDLFAAGVAPDKLTAALDRAQIEGRPASMFAARALVAAASGDGDAGALLEAASGICLTAWMDHDDPATYRVPIEAEIQIARAKLAIADHANDEGRAMARYATELLDDWPGARRAEALAIASRGQAGLAADSALTGRELDVARLVARGLTNGQIGEELYIARKTVSTHVSNILSKLNMQSRTQVAAWMASEGFADA